MRTETIPFDEFMQSTPTLGVGGVGIGDFINVEDITMGYWLIGGLGGVLITLYFLENQGYITVNDKMIKLGMAGVYGYMIYLIFKEHIIPMVL